MSFLHLPSPTARMWQHLLGHMASLEHFLPKGLTHMHPLQGQLSDRWSPMVDDPLSQEYVEAVRWWLQEDTWQSRVPLQVPTPSLLYNDASLSG